MGQDYQYNADLSCTTFSGIVRFNYHFMDHDKIDPYIGLGVGYRSVKWNYSDNDPLDINNQNEANVALSTLPQFSFWWRLDLWCTLSTSSQYRNLYGSRYCQRSNSRRFNFSDLNAQLI